MSVTLLPNLQPTLTGNSVVIRPIRADDWPAMFAAASDPLIWEVHPVRDRYKEEVFRVFFDGAVESKSGFAFCDKESGAIIGSSRYYGYDEALKEIEIGWTFLVRSRWGGTTNREVKKLMLEHAFTFADTVLFFVGETNWRSQRAMEKIGGVRRSGVSTRPSTGGPHVVFEITKDSYRL